MSSQEISPGLVIQGLTPPLRLNDFKLIAFDMDSTLINIECVDEIADAVGRKTEVAAITEAAMRGEITDFKDSLRRRVALLKGVTLASMEAVYRERLRLNPGAAELIAQCKAAGMKVLLVSSGFTFFTDRVRDLLAIDFTRSNVLEVQDGVLTGRMIAQPWGDICDGAEKRRMLLQTCELMGISPKQAIAVGDGANDLPMMAACSDVGGLSVAYHAKPKVREQAMVAINTGGLDRLLEVLKSDRSEPPAMTMKLDTLLRRPARWLLAWARNWKSHALTVLLFLLAVTAIHLWQTRDIPGGTAPAFSAPAAGQAAPGVIHLADWRQAHAGRAVALHFWADWCPICRMEEGNISAVQQDWPVLGVAMQSGDAARVQAVLNQRGLAWHSAVDPDGSLARSYGLSSVPAFIVIDAQGHIRFAEVGYTTEAGMRLRLWWAQNF